MAYDPTGGQDVKYAIKNRFTGSVVCEAEIECSADASEGIKLGLAVRVAYKSDADLRDADLRCAVLRDAVLRDADLSGADLSGAVLSGADMRGAVLRDAVLRDAVLRGAVLRGAVLRGAVLSDAVLRGAVLRGAVLSGADLSGAVLSGADLSDAVLRDALDGVPRIQNIHQSVYAAASKPDALDMGNWHTCETTHCRAGWVTTLAGDGGKALEWAIGTPAAAALIYMASDPGLEKIPDFYCDNDAALEDMKRLSELEASGLPERGVQP